MNVPENLLYTKDHEWARVEGENAVVGITDYAQGALGDITFIDLPKPGARIKQSAWCATVESVKAASDVYAPLSGEVLEVNTELSARPEAVNKDPYGKGWLAVIKAADLGEKSNLMDAAKYREYAESLSK